MKLESQVVSLPLAKKLKELGVKQESICGYNSSGHVHTSGEPMLWGDNGSGWIAAFTVAELIGMLQTVAENNIIVSLWDNTVADTLARDLISIYENSEEAGGVLGVAVFDK